MVDSYHKKRVLEVGCGCGFHSEQIAKSWISPEKSVLVSCDFSREMMVKVKKRFDTWKQEGITVSIDTETDHTSS